eukprot:5709294-Pleurochrysis_carterae.AAC.1
MTPRRALVPPRLQSLVCASADGRSWFQAFGVDGERLPNAAALRLHALLSATLAPDPEPTGKEGKETKGKGKGKKDLEAEAAARRQLQATRAAQRALVGAPIVAFEVHEHVERKQVVAVRARLLDP